MKKLAGILAIVLLAGTMLSAIPTSAAPSLYGDLGRTFFFKPTAKFKPSNDVKADNHVWFHFTNTDTRDHKFIGVITNLGPSDENNDWEIVQYCFSDACYPPLVEGRTNRELKPGEKEDMSAQFAPHDKKSRGKFGMMGTARVDIWATDNKDLRDKMYIGEVFIPFTRASMIINNKTMKLEKCLEWDPANKDRTKRYPLTVTDETLTVPPVLLGGSTFLPFRSMGEKLLGAKVDWDAKNKVAMYTIGDDKGYFKMMLPINKKEATLILKCGDGTTLTDKVALKVAPTIYQGSTVVPLRGGVVELFGGYVEWTQAEKKATIILPPPEKEE